jgi:exosortase
MKANAITESSGRTPADRRVPSFTVAPADRIALAILAIGSIAIFAPTIAFVARTSWNSDTGGHGPIVMMTGFWLLWRLWPDAAPVATRPPMWRIALLLLVFVPAYIVARITQIVELEGFLMYGCVLTALYSAIGGAAMKRLWFPLVYLGFIFPPPDTLVAIVTVPLKIWISHFAVMILKLFGYPAGNAGVSIFIGQYSLLVAAACSGLNSLISLAAISLFYIYIRHQAEWQYAILLVLLTIPVALVANLVRVLALILITYYAGNAAGEGFLHNFAGILMFTVAVLTMFGVDALMKPLWDRFFTKEDTVLRKPAAI